MENLEVGELVLLKYPGEFKDDDTMAKIVEVHPNANGLVGQVTVQFKDRNPKESTAAYKCEPSQQDKCLELVDEELQQVGGGVKSNEVNTEGAATPVLHYYFSHCMFSGNYCSHLKHPLTPSDSH